jgi:anhydro-N-acetylmuramic acid kinase
MAYDERGQNARMGEIDERLMDELNRSWYYEKRFPKTLGGGWVRKVLMPVFRHYHIPIEDMLRTYTEHVARQISLDIAELGRMDGIEDLSKHKMLVTGGGAFNDYMMERIEDECGLEVVIPADDLVKFKEALIIALMGILRKRDEVNCLATVTGATRDSVGGIIFA